MGIYFKLFKTLNNYYLYDRETNSIVLISEDDFSKLSKGMAANATSGVVKKLQSRGFLKDSILKEIHHSDTELLPDYLNTKINQLIIQITQSCNLRCSYCSYSGNYNNQRTHSLYSMPIKTLQKAIEFFVLKTADNENRCLSFYGGEPLLEMEKIRWAIGYIGINYPTLKVRYQMTTNGTLLNKDTVKFLVENDFFLTISLDGTEEQHNRYRKFQNGNGSFEIIAKNLSYIKEYYPEFYKNISFNSVLSPINKLCELNEFYNCSSMFKAENTVQINTINQNNIKDPIYYSGEFFETSAYEEMKVLLKVLGYYDKGEVSKAFRSYFINIQQAYFFLARKNTMASKSHPGGPCLPGVKRPMVDIHGNIFPCERTSEISEAMKIGTLNHGYNMAKAASFLNIAEITKDECMKCWNFNMCSLCAVMSEENGSFCSEARLSKCELAKMKTINTFKEICVLSENNFDFEEEVYI